MEQSVDNLQELQKTKWNEFKKKYSARIAFYPTTNGKKSIPAVWNNKLQEWVWVSRAQRRQLEKRIKR